MAAGAFSFLSSSQPRRPPSPSGYERIPFWTGFAYPEPYKMLSSAPRDVFPLYAANTSPNRLARRELDLAE